MVMRCLTRNMAGHGEWLSRVFSLLTILQIPLIAYGAPSSGRIALDSMQFRRQPDLYLRPSHERHIAFPYSGKKVVLNNGLENDIYSNIPHEANIMRSLFQLSHNSANDVKDNANYNSKDVLNGFDFDDDSETLWPEGAIDYENMEHGYPLYFDLLTLNKYRLCLAFLKKEYEISRKAKRKLCDDVRQELIKEATEQNAREPSHSNSQSDDTPATHTSELVKSIMKRAPWGGQVRRTDELTDLLRLKLNTAKRILQKRYQMNNDVGEIPDA